jgi:hypothetical protein
LIFGHFFSDWEYFVHLKPKKLISETCFLNLTRLVKSCVCVCVCVFRHSWVLFTKFEFFFCVLWELIAAWNEWIQVPWLTDNYHGGCCGILCFFGWTDEPRWGSLVAESWFKAH